MYWPKKVLNEKWMKLVRDRLQGLWIASAFLVGMTAPMAVLGRAAMALTLLPGFITLVLYAVKNIRREILDAARSSTYIRLVLVLTLVAICFLPFSIDFPRSAGVLARTVGLAVGGWIAAWVLSRDPALGRAAWSGLGWGASVAALYALVSIHVIGYPVWPLGPGKPGPEGVALAFKAYSSVAALLVVLFACRVWMSRDWRARIGFGGIAVLCLAVVISNDADVSRSALIGIAVAVFVPGLVFVFGHLPNQAFRWGAMLVLVSAVLGGFAFLASTLAVVVGESPIPPVLPLEILDAHRQIIWGFAWDLFTQRPILGWGLDTSNLTPGASNFIPGWNVEFIPAHTHNFVLELLVDAGGILSLLLFGAILFILMDQVRLILEGKHAHWLPLLVQSAFWAASFSNFSIWSFWWLCAFACILIVAKAVRS